MPDDIIATLRRAVFASDLGELRAKMQLWNPDDVFNLLFPMAVHEDERLPSHRATPVHRAARLLFLVVPASTITCEQAVGAMLPHWNHRDPELPWYLARHFGAETTQSVVEELRKRSLPLDQLERLRAITQWIEKYQRYSAAEIEEMERWMTS